MDAVGWFRSRWDVFDPKGIIGVFGLFFFFVSPLLAIVWEVEVPYVPNPSDWRPWYGAMACLNILGLIFYNLFQFMAFNSKKPLKVSHWNIDPNRAMIVAPVAFLVAFIGQTIFLAAFGGWSGIMDWREYGAGFGIRGMGPFMLLGHSAPPLLLIVLTIVYMKERLKKQASIVTVSVVLVAFLVCQFYVSGLQGSRSVVVWGLFWAVGIVHFFWRRVTIKMILVGLIPFLFFMYIYGFYKTLGRQSFELLTGAETIENLQVESKRTFKGMLLGDLSRTDIQAAIVYILQGKPYQYDYRFGKTYLYSAVAYVPYWIFPDKPHSWSKNAAGTEVQRDKGSYDPYTPGKKSTRVYGLAGEAMLNFGLFGIIPLFALWGYFTGRFRRKLLARHSTDAFLLLVPIFINLAFITLAGDSDNFVYFLIDKIAVPFVVVRMMCTKQIFFVVDGNIVEQMGEV